MNDNKFHIVKGKPFMVIEYDPLTSTPLRCEFGLSEAKNIYLPGVQGAIPEPFMSANILKYSNKLNLTGSVNILISWGDKINVDEQLSAGGYRFSVDKGDKSSGHEIFNFVFTNEGMEGEIKNETASWGGRVSDDKAFKLLRKFNSSTLE